LTGQGYRDRANLRAHVEPVYSTTAVLWTRRGPIDRVFCYSRDAVRIHITGASRHSRVYLSLEAIQCSHLPDYLLYFALTNQVSAMQDTHDALPRGGPSGFYPVGWFSWANVPVMDWHVCHRIRHLSTPTYRALLGELWLESLDCLPKSQVGVWESNLG
jgi:hypothetical protein